MRGSNKYLFAVVFLFVLSVVFGLAGTVAPMSEPVSPQLLSSPPSVTHFVNPPTFDSGWMDITDKAGQSFNITHDLNTTDALIDVVGRQSLTSDNHKLFFGSTVYIQEFNKTYGGALDDWANSLVRTNDGGYASAGATISFGAGSQDFWFVKMNSDLDIEWNQTYGGGHGEIAHSMVQTSDGGYALAGSTWSVSAGFDFWLVRTDSTGNMLWNRTIGGVEDDVPYSVVQTNDGGFALAGYTNSFGADRKDFWLVKTDSNGNHLWNQTYGGTKDDISSTVVQTSDGGYALAGYTLSYGAGGNDLWLVKTNAAGNWLWGRTHGGIGNEYAYALIQTTDGGYALAGYTNSFGAGATDFWLVKTDSLGFMQWSQTYGGASTDAAYAVVETGDGGYVLAGYTDSFGAGSWDFWLVKTGVGELGSSMGLSMTDLANSTITFYRGSGDPFWSYVRVCIWVVEEPTWMFGDINQDGVVDAQDLFILSQNYGKTFSLLSLSGIVTVAGIHTYKKRRQPK